jgi:glycosyltransferase involved in cell wall biosynthesis
VNSLTNDGVASGNWRAQRVERPRPADESRICLNMIVKDEARIIERCLASLAPIIDYYVICDTGSTDATPLIAREYLARHHIAGRIHRLPFVDFATTRNASLALCRRSRARFDYILLADADMELLVGACASCAR